MEAEHWLALGGVLLLIMSLANSWFARLPFSSAMLYLLIGMAFSPLWLGVITLNAVADAQWLEHVAELVVLISLFTSGLKLNMGSNAALNRRRWHPTVRLAVVSMLFTVALVSVAGVLLLGLSVGAAILLGGILAPTDPVLASEVQVIEPNDRDQLRFALTGEGGLNDGTAFPVVMLGLGLMGLHEIGSYGWRWVVIDVAWAGAVGIAIGIAMGTGIGQLVLHLRQTHKHAFGFDNFLALGIIAAAYGIALMADAYGFLAVFAAGVALRRVEHIETALTTALDTSSKTSPNTALNAASDTASTTPLADKSAIASIANDNLTIEGMNQAAIPSNAGNDALATDAILAPAYMAHAVLSFNEQLERLGEVIIVIVIGILLWSVNWRDVSWLFIGLLFLLLRPFAVTVGLIGIRMSHTQKNLIGWFGIRGVGSIFYLMYALNHNVPSDVAEVLVTTTLSVVAASIVLHGVSVTGLMNRYQKRIDAKRIAKS